MAGNPYFPYVFGMIKPDSIIFEYICENNGMPSPTLYDFLAQTSLPQHKLVIIGIDICKAVHHLHIKGLLHNDLHPRNILIRNKLNVKIIDLGKPTMISDPVKYTIEVGSKRHEKFNTVHRFLAHELRNVPDSYQTVTADIYSLGHNIDFIARSCKNTRMTSLAVNMMNKVPEK